ncbi:hypothetical protein [Streptomyces sp. NPDC029526]|uniref:hypothetical protein n=1 Tax=Streptomyces sp. NPDC029526 TaxID=3155728 RepID=UPI00340A8382
MTQPTVYRVEFGPAWPVPPIVLPYTDPNVFHRAITAHAMPHLVAKLTEMGRPELADCFFQTDRDLTAGQFMWLDLAGEKAARFCSARLTPVEVEEGDGSPRHEIWSARCEDGCCL